MLLTVNAGETATGKCGENLYWELNSSGVLSITGSGRMTDWQNTDQSGYSHPNTPWYSDRAVIKTVMLGSNVTSIGNYAFTDCVNLTKVSVPSGLTTIGINAFKKCKVLADITIPANVTSIGEGAFQGCRGLKEITISSGVTSIGKSAFEGCAGVSDVLIPSSVTSVAYAAFRGCTGLLSITFESATTAIEMDGNTITSGVAIYGHDDSTAENRSCRATARLRS